MREYTIVLSSRALQHYGALSNVDKDSVSYTKNLNSANELSFDVYKTLDGFTEPSWTDIRDLRLVYVVELNEYFEIAVTEYDSNLQKKSITATSLCEAELSQVYLNDIQINTEEDIERDDYDEDYPTIFYRPQMPEASLLHRILDKVPQYQIGYVDDTLMYLQRTFEIDGETIYDFLTGDCADEFNCLFVFDSTTRTISAYDLYNTCMNDECSYYLKHKNDTCKYHLDGDKEHRYRGDFTNCCPECGSTNFTDFGFDTTIFIDKENLTDEVTLEGDKDSLKNVFRLTAGDDLMSNTIAAINPNGTRYIYYISDDTKSDMPDALVEKIDSYDALYKYYLNEHKIWIDTDLYTDYLTEQTDYDPEEDVLRQEVRDVYDGINIPPLEDLPDGSGHVTQAEIENLFYSTITVDKLEDTDILQTDVFRLLTFGDGSYTDYNTLIDRINDLMKLRTEEEDENDGDDYTDDYHKFNKLDCPIVGYADLMEAVYENIDFELYLKNGMMPTYQSADINANSEKEALEEAYAEGTFKTVSLAKLTSKTSQKDVESSILNYVKAFVKTGYVKVTVQTSSWDSEAITQSGSISSNTWVGNFKIVNYSDESDEAETIEMTLEINNDYENYMKHKVGMLYVFSEMRSLMDAYGDGKGPLGTVSIKILTKTTSKSTVEGYIKNLIKVYVRTKYVDITINTTYWNNSTPETTDGINHKTWKGTITLTSSSEETAYKTTDTLEITINDDQKNYLIQESYKNMNSDDDDVSDGNLWDVLMTEDLASLYSYLQQYSLARLTSFKDAYQAAIDVLIDAQQGTTQATLYEDLYVPYTERLKLCQTAMAERQEQIDLVEEMYNRMEEIQQEIQAKLDFEDYLGEYLYNVFCCYRRENNYENTNFTSDGLDNDKLFAKAKEFWEDAQKEIVKAGTMQYTIDTTLNDLLEMPEFAPLVDYFEIGNWIRVRVDDEVYRLRLISIEEDKDNINVEFSDVTTVNGIASDVQSILESAASMATSYNSVMRQSIAGQRAANTLNNGLNTGSVSISSGDNQVQTWDSHGLWCRRYDSITNQYTDDQLRLLNSGLYITTDGWDSVATSLTAEGLMLGTSLVVPGGATVDFGDALSWDGETLYVDGNGTFTGNVYAEDGVFNGTVYATDGRFEGTVYATDGVFEGTVYAHDGRFEGSVYATDGVFNGSVYATDGVFNGNVYATDGVFNGTVYATDGKFTGVVEATDGVFHGNVYATDGVFNGTVYATDGEFTGKVTATAGEIGGAIISDGLLTVEAANIGSISTQVLEAGIANIDLLTSETLKAGTAFIDSLTAQTASIAVATIDTQYVAKIVANNITVADLKAGDIVLREGMRIMSDPDDPDAPGNGLLMSGYEFQILDKDNNPAISIGYNTLIDEEGQYYYNDKPSIVIRDGDGAIMLNSLGLSEGDPGIATMVQSRSLSSDTFDFDIVKTDDGNIIVEKYDGSESTWGKAITDFANDLAVGTDNLIMNSETMIYEDYTFE